MSRSNIGKDVHRPKPTGDHYHSNSGQHNKLGDLAKVNLAPKSPDATIVPLKHIKVRGNGSITAKHIG